MTAKQESFNDWWATHHPFDWWNKERGEPLPHGDRVLVRRLCEDAYEYARVDPPAAPTVSRNCVNCRHSNVDREGVCKAQVSPPNYRNITYCGCRCVFPPAPVAPPAPDGADQALARKLIHGLGSINKYEDRVDFAITALAQARKEGALTQRETDVETCRDIQKLNEQCEIDSTDEKSKYAYSCYAAGADQCAVGITAPQTGGKHNG